jgi:outer membrane protein assembly factor BamA
LRLVLPGAFFLCLPAIIYAQIPHRLKECLPYPTLADEMCEMAGRGCGGEQDSKPRVFIDTVNFVGGNSLPADVREQVFATVKFGDVSPGPFSKDWLSELADVRFRQSLQNAGYFKALVETQGEILESGPLMEHVSVTVRIDEGPRFRLDSIQFRPVTESEPLVFSQDELRKQINLADGSFFDVGKIRDGLESLARLYGRRGYIDFTAEPRTELDEKTGLISVVLALNLEKQYRIGKVEVWGPTPVVEKTLQAQWITGDIFNVGKLNDFFKNNAALLPADASRDDLKVDRHSSEGTVDLRFDFRVCSPVQK